MKQTKEIKKEFIIYEHSFYCDECHKYLGTSQEYDDGWYKDIGDFELKIYIDGWYRIKKCLCDDCRKHLVTELNIRLINMGFKKD